MVPDSTRQSSTAGGDGVLDSNDSAIFINLLFAGCN